MSEPKVAVIIPALNEGAMIESLLQSLSSNTYKNKEIIVVDGGSTDNTLEICRKYNVTILSEEGEYKCPANARNQGAYYTEPEILCFLDADVDHVNDRFIENVMLRFAADQAIASIIVARKVIINTVIEELNTVDITPPARSGNISPNYDIPTFWRKNCFLEIGGYPILGANEDKLLRDKLVEYLCNTNYKIYFESHSIRYIHGPHTIKELWKSYAWYGRTYLYGIKYDYTGRKFSQYFWEFMSLYFPSFYAISLTLSLSVFITKYALVFTIPIVFLLIRSLIYSFLNKSSKPLYNSGLTILKGYALTYGLLKYIAAPKNLSRG